MKKVFTKSGAEVFVSVQGEEIRCEFTHPKLGKVISYGTRYVDGEGLHTTSHTKKAHITLSLKKSDIVPLLQEIEMAKKAEKERIEKEYEKLREKLPPLPKLENTPDEKKFREIMGKINNASFSGTEDEGLRLYIAAHNDEIRAEARQYCDHSSLEIKYKNTFTADARRKVVRIVRCPKCGFLKIDEVEEPLKLDWI